MDIIWNKIAEMAEQNDGLIKTGMVEKAGIGRYMLKRYLDAGKLVRVRKGIYVLGEGLADEYALLQAQCSKAVFSYGTALYLWGMSDRVPHNIDITIPQGTNLTRLRKDNPDLRCHYVQPELYELGISQVQSPQGGAVQLYDKERCICDLIRHKDQIEMQLYTQSIQEYFKNQPNRRKLLKYGKLFGIEEKIRTYMEVLA